MPVLRLITVHDSKWLFSSSPFLKFRRTADSAQQGMEEVTLADGGSYRGELKGDAPHGQGKCAWPDGSTYEGEWRSGKMHGKGNFQAGQHTYVGAFFKVCDETGCAAVAWARPATIIFHGGSPV